MYLQIAFVLAEFDLVHEPNVGIKRIYANMKAQNLASQIYTRTKKSITLILNNNIDERTKKFNQAAKETDQDTDQADQDTDQKLIEKRIISAIQTVPQMTH